MTWFVLRKIKRPIKDLIDECPNKYLKFGLRMAISDLTVYQEGLVLMNEKGKKKVVWEELLE